MTQQTPQTHERSDVVIVDDHDGVSLITLEPPKALNAFNGELFRSLNVALDQAAEDPDVGCVVLTGAGRAFTAGMDMSDEPAPDAPNPYDALIECVETYSKPLIVAINGLAIGIGTTILGHCDIALAAESARFRMPFTGLGLVPEAGSTVTIPALIGRQRAAEALFTGRWISSAEAADGGLVLRTVPDDQLIDQALELAGQIAAQPLESLVETKRLMLASRLPAAHESRLREEEVFRRLLAGPAHAEALAAFREKREPNFRQLSR